jgi:hypothetical protein
MVTKFRERYQWIIINVQPARPELIQTYCTAFCRYNGLMRSAMAKTLHTPTTREVAYTSRTAKKKNAALIPIITDEIRASGRRTAGK